MTFALPNSVVNVKNNNKTADNGQFKLMELWAHGETIILTDKKIYVGEKKKRCEQGSNLRGETPLDFKSNALTTRPSQLTTSECA